MSMCNGIYVDDAYSIYYELLLLVQRKKGNKISVYEGMIAGSARHPSDMYGVSRDAVYQLPNHTLTHKCNQSPG